MRRSSYFGTALGGFFTVLVFLIILAVLMSVPTYLLWNWVCVDVLELKRITVLQALGMNLLANILFKSSSSSKD